MPYAYFANFENPTGDAVRALHESVATVMHAETLGFEQAWVTEHHFNRYSVSASIFPLLAALAVRTTRIGLGAGAVLLPMHDPIRVAEDAATVDALSGGRLLLGVARGGPFPDQFRHFGVSQDETRARLPEAVQLVERLLTETGVSHAGAHYRCDDVTVQPRPVRQPPPIWLASLSAPSVALAAARGYGLMAPSAAPVENLRPVLAALRAARPDGGRPLVLARYFHCHRNHAAARATAAAFVRDFAANMGAAVKRMAEAGETLLPFHQQIATLTEERLLANALVGDPAAVREQLLALRAAVGPHVLMLKPATFDPAEARAALTLFAEQVRPALED